MGCGCGGSAQSAEKVPRQRAAGSTPPRSAVPADGGFVWKGPTRSAPKPEPTAPRP
jgi:hypothetical protein